MRVLKICAVLCALILAFGSVPAVSAADFGGWTELLEYVSIHNNGSNVFTVNGSSGSLIVPLPSERRLRKIDLLIRNPSGQRFSTAKVTAGGSTLNLEVFAVGGNLTRVIGYLPDSFYSSIKIDLTKSTTSVQSYEVLSCKVTALGVQEFQCNAQVYLSGGYYGTQENIDIAATDPNQHHATMLQTRIDIKDWQKYDHISVWGSTDMLSIDSIRATSGTLALPITVNYFEQNDSGEYVKHVFENDPYHDYVIEGGSSLSTPFFGKYLYNIEFDLTGVDRTLTDPIYVYLTGHYDQYFGATFTCMYVNGSVVTADTSSVSWWTRFTMFMQDLFSPDSSASDEYQEEAGQQRDELDEMNQQLENVSKPSIGNIQMDVNDYVDRRDTQSLAGALAGLTSNSLMISMMSIVLTIALVGYVLYGKR